ncbi:retention module-containing protein [Marinobacterium rhizophilum]|uniref:Retention module-containing protein n=1 Tax=Marinobacterium rhizophilum TaxID=420402 RepID=A0ABY5HJ04_9GAMM|nr:retention module-containing protein [Marinobacterium rhizophilum]UTW11269.1 retention module-containing protein [Marinobacterium rhizophilum]
MAIAEVAGTVSFITGAVVAVSQDGSERLLALGDDVYSNETVRTEEGARVEIASTLGHEIVLGAGEELLMSTQEVASDSSQVAAPVVAATVSSVMGTAVAIAADGSERILSAGDPVFEGELLRVAAGGRIELQSNAGETVELVGGQDVLVAPEFHTELARFDPSESVASNESVNKALVSVGEVDAIQSAILAGQDPTAIAEATAAGQAPGAGAAGPDDSGSSFVMIDRTGQEVSPQAGYNTSGLSRSISNERTEDTGLVNSAPGVSVDPGNGQNGAEGPDDSVNEAGLAGGSAAGDGSDAASGTFTLSDADGLDDLVSVTINGSTILIADLEGSVIAGANGHGNLTIDSYNAATGVASYSYQLSGPVTDVDGVAEQDLFTLSVSDGSASSANSSITIDIVDDVPVAVDDDSKALGEDDSAAISGNVLSNDLHGNGRSRCRCAGDLRAVDRQHQRPVRQLHRQRQWRLQLHAQHRPCRGAGLDDGQSLTETFSYQITDADGDTDTATLTLTINGSNDGPGVSVDPGNVGGGNDSVNEAGLAGGSAAGDGSDAASGTFTLSDADGLDDLVSVTINGSTILIADLEGSVIAGANGHGNLTIDSYNAATGVASYSYQLSGPVTDVDGVAEQDLFTLSVSDGSASSANSSITIDIVDDVPVAVDDSKALGEDDSAAISGNVLSNDLHGNGEAGADAPVTFVQWTGSTSGQYGSFTDNGNGGYSYTLNTAHAAVQGLDDGQSLTETFSYQITDADGDTDTATLTLTINGSNDGPASASTRGNVTSAVVTTASTKRVWPAVPPQVTAAMPPAVPLPCPTPMAWMTWSASPSTAAPS